MSRSAQSQEPRRTIAKTTARGRPPVTSLRKVLSATRRAMPPRLPRREKHLGQPPCRTHRPSPAAKTIRQQRAPVPKRAPPPIRAGGAFPVCPFRSFLQHEPQRAIARTAPHDRQNNSARPSARHIAAQSPVSHTPRHAAPPAAPRKTLGPAVMPGAPPRHENSPVSRTPHAAPHRPARHISAHNPANRAKIGQHPTGRTAPAPP